MDEKIIWSIGFVLIVIILCIVKPNAGRIFLGIFYLIMALGVNQVGAITNPPSKSLLQRFAETKIKTL